MDSREGEILYTSRHLHVSLPRPATDSWSSPQDISSEECASRSSDHCLSPENREQFYRSGYYIIPNCASRSSIQRCRQYINDCWQTWMVHVKRPDDWRCHFMLNIEDLLNSDKDAECLHGDSIDPVLKLYLDSKVLQGHVYDLIGRVKGLFYTQIAIRTPYATSNYEGPPKRQVKQRRVYCESYLGTRDRSDYHLDGQCNRLGSRFPDYWSLIVGIALNDQIVTDCGNFTVFPGSHTARPWHDYPNHKLNSGRNVSSLSKMNNLSIIEEAKLETTGAVAGCDCDGCLNPLYKLPDLGPPVQIKLRAGDAVVAHVLLAHRGGRNTEGSKESTFQSGVESSESLLSHIPKGSREMVFFRIQKSGVDYVDSKRSEQVLNNVWCEMNGYVVDKH